MLVLTKQQIAQAETAAPLTDSEMMENAGLAAALYALDMRIGPRYAVFCGCGNNGGDGFVAARELRKRGASADCFVFSRELSALAKEKMDLFEAEFGKVTLIDERDDISALLSKYSVVIDAIFGTGLSREVTGIYAKVIGALDGSVPTLSLDIPSGIECDSGKVLGCAVMATDTITFTAAKPAHFLYPGYIHTGRLTATTVGFDPPQGTVFSADEGLVQTVFPKRPAESHKGHYGSVMLLCGSEGYTGAAAFAAFAAVRGGAGLVNICVPRAIYNITAVKLNESIVTPMPCDDDGKISADALPELLERAKKADVMLIGCGLGRSPDVSKVVQTLVKEAPTQLILDADGINGLEGNIDLLSQASCTPILTPHDGELARLFGGEVPFAAENRLSQTVKCAQRLSSTLVRKGHRTMVADRFGNVCINTAGNPGMARGGSGDLLAGLVAAFSAQGIAGFEAASAAVYVHALAGDLAARELGEVGMTPGDMILGIPRVLKKILGR